MRFRFVGLFGLVLTVFACLAQAQVYEGTTLVKARLVADTTAIVAGEPFRVGVVLEMAPRWHTYWKYSGDAGIPTTVDWNLPEGFAAGPLEWPLPEGILEPGDIQVYAYGDEVMLIQTLRPPDGLDAETINLAASVKWLVCEEICIPGGADVDLELPVAATAEPANVELFEKYSALLPAQDSPPFTITWNRTGDQVEGHVPPEAGVDGVEFFPLPTAEQTVGHPSVSGSAGDGFTVKIDFEGDGDLRGVIAARWGNDRKGWWVETGDSSGLEPAIGVGAPTTGAGSPSLLTILFYGFLGGIILNLMPCVLPVISLKIFGFVRQSGQHPRVIFLHGVAFAAGVFAWFLGLAAVIVAIKAGGEEVNWAFQFQNPWFNLVIATIVFVFALNLFGVFEIALPGRAANAMAGAGGHEGFSGSFFQGVFATLLATPCTGPFLGVSLGYAFAQSAGVIVALFGCIAFGMALPYLLLSAQPGWIRFLPKPGAWMERLKQFMGFPLLAALLWLLYVIGSQQGMEAIIWVGAFFVCLAISCWLYGIASSPTVKPRGRAFGLIAAVLIAVAGAKIFLGDVFDAERAKEVASSASEDGIPWEPYSAAKVDELLAEGKPVFIDFTAEWCLTCKYNERTAINVPAVRERFEELGIVPIKADWTNSNPEITAALKKFGRVGVPFYVYYPAGDAENPVTLPELLTQSLVLEKLSAPEVVSSKAPE